MCTSADATGDMALKAVCRHNQRHTGKERWRERDSTRLQSSCVRGAGGERERLKPPNSVKHQPMVQCQAWTERLGAIVWISKCREVVLCVCSSRVLCVYDGEFGL